MTGHPALRGMTQDEWMRHGWERGFCSPPVCVSHDGVPTTEQEDDDPDLCVTIVRLYRSGQEASEVAENSSEVLWRARDMKWTDPH